MKIPISRWVIVVKRDQEAAKQCYQLATKDELKAFPIEANVDIEK